MLVHERVEENLRFLIREVRKQVRRAQRYMATLDSTLLHSLRSRDNYIDNLRTFIQRACFTYAGNPGNVEYYKAIDIIAVNLERIADFCEDLTDQMQYVEHPKLLHDTRVSPFVDEVMRGLGMIEEAVSELNVHVALSICRTEARLDECYAAEFKRCLTELRAGEAVETHVTLLFIWHYFERMGDALLNIGEAVISAALGEKIKIGQFWALEDTLGEARPDHSLDELALHAVGESKSGCRIVRVSERDAGGLDNASVIFKEGEAGKLFEEKEGIERWENELPGMAPKIFSFHDNGPNSAILLEFFTGRTFEQVLLEGSHEELRAAFAALTSTLTAIWKRTRRDEAQPATFLAQLKRRLPDVYAFHPHFRQAEVLIGGLTVAPLETLIERAAELEAGLSAPFQVLNHGDFNIDNIIFGTRDQGVRVIDLHRSGLGDYVQDVSVFLVSNYRLQIFETPVRSRINHVTKAFHKLARAYAKSQGDETFEVRLAFGLARSFATSTRFILDERFAKTLFLRARYLLELLAETPLRAAAEFEIPEEVLCD